jgi:DNA mismatch repair protein MutL
MIAGARIHVMAPDLALKIAAGEVVERPAAAVKELLDNAIDAEATRIAIDIREGGLKLLQVVDDGCGIPADDLPLAFQSHATSKIRSIDDLEQLSSLGFRGEALGGSGTISRVELRTRADGEDVGARLSVDFGEIGVPAPCATPRGTRVTVHDLFANVPARREFVRSLRAEAGQIAMVVTRHALAHPSIRFTLTIDDRVTFASPGTGRLEDVIAEVFGAAAVSSMISVAYEDRGIGVSGAISTPALSRSNRQSIVLFVNGRPVSNRSLLFALEEAYSGYLMIGRHPLAVINLWVPAHEVDANIHPAKSEVRFVRDREVHGVLHRAVAAALLENRLTERASLDPDERDATAEPAVLPVQPSLVPAEPQRSSDDAPAALKSMPVLRVFGQANGTFIIAEGPTGLYMIDQHAAHERILFDTFDAELDAGAVLSQPLLEPASVEISPAQMAALETNEQLLRRSGFDLEPFGAGNCLVRAIPALARRATPLELVNEVLSELENMIEPRAARERTLAAMACKAAVKAGETLGLEEMRELVLQLERTPRPATCPHGRPTMIHLSNSQLEREFGRR